mgnify:CR=1 FL=1
MLKALDQDGADNDIAEDERAASTLNQPSRAGVWQILTTLSKRSINCVPLRHLRLDDRVESDGRAPRTMSRHGIVDRREPVLHPTKDDHVPRYLRFRVDADYRRPHS